MEEEGEWTGRCGREEGGGRRPHEPMTMVGGASSLRQGLTTSVGHLVEGVTCSAGRQAFYLGLSTDTDVQ